MRVLIYGLGGVGGYLATYFSLTGHEIVGIARGEHLKMIQKKGLRVEDNNTSIEVKLEAIDETKLSGYFDLVLFCVKSYDLEKAACTCKPFIDEKSVVLSLSNGVEHAQKLRSLVDAKVLDGCIYILSHIQKAGTIKKLGDVFNIVFAGEGEERLAEILDEAKLRYKIAQDIQEAIWKKYIFISTFGVLTSYFDIPIKAVYDRHYEVTKEYLTQVCNIAKAKNIDIEVEIEKSLLTASKLPESASTSMHKDIKAKKRDELETLCGYLVREAKRLHVDAKRIENCYQALLKQHHA
jgi:2-dehydropantoate 2-reductase